MGNRDSGSARGRAASNPALPVRRIARGVKHGKDDEVAAFLAVVDAVRKPWHNCLPYVLQDDGVYLRVGRHSCNDLIDGQGEWGTQPGLSVLVPIRGPVELVPGFGEAGDG